MAGEGVDLKEYILRVIADADARYEQRFKSIELAATTASVMTRENSALALTAVRESAAAAITSNKTLAEKAEQFADQKLEAHNSIKPWVQALIDSLSKEVDAIDKRVARFENREEGIGWTTKLIIGAVGLLATLLGIYFAFK